MINEIWKDIKEYEGYYQISNFGRIKSLSRNSKNCCGVIRLKEKILLGSPNSHGYVQVLLYKHGNRKQFKLHRLVATYFIPNIENKIEVNHIDGNKANNKAGNLEWATPSENTIHAHKIGLVMKRTGKENHRSKKILAYDVDNNLVKTYENARQAQDEGYCNSMISRACNGLFKDNIYKNLIWRYAS